MKLHLHVASALALSVFASSAFAQGHFGEREEPNWSLRVDSRAYEKGDFDSVGDLGLTRWGGTLARTWPGDEAGESAVFSFRHEESRYDFGRGAFLIVPDSIEDTKGDTLTGAYESGDDDRRWFFDLSVVSGRSGGVSLSDSLYGEGAGGVLFRASESLELGIGIAGRTRLEEDDQIFPLPLVDWHATDDLRVSVIASANPGVLATYRFHERLEAYASVRSEERQFRLENQGLLQDAAAVDSEFGGLAGLVWHGTGLEIEVFGGVASRNLEIDSDGAKSTDDDVDAVGLVGASLTWIF